MIARVVPVTRIRRDTSSWSYTLPSHSGVVPGALVVVPFAGRDVLGVVWETAPEDDKASKPVSRVLCPQPVIKAPQRQFIERLSQDGLCSLSTALYVWLPRALRQWPLRKASLQLINEYRPPESPAPQHCILVPGRRPEQEQLLASRFNEGFVRLYSDAAEAAELEDWFRILRGEVRVGLGREGALFAPWANLRQVTVVEPEDIFYYHEQTPYLSLSDLAGDLASLTNATLTARSYLPTPAAELLWPGASGNEQEPSSVQLIDLHKEPLINEHLLTAIRNALVTEKNVLLLYNAHDRMRTKTKEGIAASVLVPGIESLGRQLAVALGRAALGPEIILGTRSVFDTTHENVGLVAALSLDPLLDTELFSDQLHGLADIGHLFSYGCPAIIQAYRQDHPMMDAIRNRRLPEYAVRLLEEQREHALPPFGQQIVLAFPDKEGSRELVDAVRLRLEPLVQAPWQLSHPLQVRWHKKPYLNLILETENPRERVPAALRKMAVSLPSPWKILRNPVHIM